MIAAPNSSTAMRATSGRNVSTDTTASGCAVRTAFRAVRMRSISSAAVTLAAPGRVE